MPQQRQLEIGLNDASPYRVLHTADWHLGKTLDRRSRQDEHQRFLDWLLATIQQQSVDCLLVAGDIFDSPRPPQSAERMYYEFLARLHDQANCVAVITSGNHDSPRHLDAPKNALKALNVHVVGELPENIADAIIPLPSAEEPQLLIAAIPFLRDRDVRTGKFGDSEDKIRAALQAGIKQRYAEAAAECRSTQKQHPHAAMMAVGHLTVTDCQTSDSELAIHVGGLGELSASTFPTDFSYVALGHIHRPQSFNENAAGHPHVAYSGSPIPLSFSEAGNPKSVQVLDFADGQLVDQRQIEIPNSRELVQLTVTREKLEDQLAEFEPPAGELTTWVELVVETTRQNEPLNELVEGLTADADFEVITTAINWVGEAAKLSEADVRAYERELENVLEDPRRVFALRLEKELELEEADAAALKTAFEQLLELHATQRADDPTEEPSRPPKMQTPLKPMKAGVK